MTVRVAVLLTYTVLKILAFQDRHENKDAYDLVFVILNHVGGPTAAGRASAASAIAGHPQATEAIDLLSARFVDADHDGPHAYVEFLADPDDDEAKARLRNEAVAAIDQYPPASTRRLERGPWTAQDSYQSSRSSAWW